MGLSYSSDRSLPENDKIIIYNLNLFPIVLLKITINLDETTSFKTIIKIESKLKTEIKISRKDEEFIYIYNFSFIYNMNMTEEEFMKINIRNEKPVVKIKSCHPFKDETNLVIIN